MRSGLVLYRLVFIKNAPVCAGAFFCGKWRGGRRNLRRCGARAERLGGKIRECRYFCSEFLSSAEERGVGTAGFRRRIRGVAV